MDYDELLSELKAIRLRCDQIAAKLLGERATEELLPVWSCGHRHKSRTEAVACLQRFGDNADREIAALASVVPT